MTKIGNVGDHQVGGGVRERVKMPQSVKILALIVPRPDTSGAGIEVRKKRMDQSFLFEGERAGFAGRQCAFLARWRRRPARPSLSADDAGRTTPKIEI